MRTWTGPGWSIVQALVFDGGTLEWVSFATAVAAVPRSAAARKALARTG